MFQQNAVKATTKTESVVSTKTLQLAKDALPGKRHGRSGVLANLTSTLQRV